MADNVHAQREEIFRRIGFEKKRQLLRRRMFLHAGAAVGCIVLLIAALKNIPGLAGTVAYEPAAFYGSLIIQTPLALWLVAGISAAAACVFCTLFFRDLLKCKKLSYEYLNNGKPDRVSARRR